MKYRLHLQGQDLGSFSLEELRRRRRTGELTGAEHVWREGMADWETLDAVLAASGLPSASSTPPPLPTSAAKRKVARWLVAVLATVSLVLIGGLVLGVYKAVSIGKRAMEAYERVNRDGQLETGTAAGPIVSATNAMTYRDVQERARKFRWRQWVDGYRERGSKGSSCDEDSLHALERWIAQNYGGSTNVETNSLSALCDRLAASSVCNDPLVLTMTGIESIELFEKKKRLERALDGFRTSGHHGYPKLYAAVSLADTEQFGSRYKQALDQLSLRYFQESLADGSILPGDQPEMADILITGWGYDFFYRAATAAAQITKSAGKQYEWLGLMLEGERHVMLAWRARGGGYADTVTEQGWEGFRTNLVVARRCFDSAWRLHPEWPLAAARMVYVAMSDSGAREMRLWFDRAVAAQIDHPGAWSSLQFGLRPRWHGSHEAMLALGISAVDTGRFDTDVPRKFFDVVTDLESDLQLKRGRHLYGRPDIWPHFQRMYEGYIAEPLEGSRADGWRSTYSLVAWFAGKYDVARQQLEAVKWQPTPGSFNSWGADVSLMVLEVAARTGPLGPQIAAAETSRLKGDLDEALRQLKELAGATDADERTRNFILHRQASLELETRLGQGGWVEMLPTDQNDRAWRIVEGKVRRLPDGALEVASGQRGHMLYSRARMGPTFEVKGEFEAISSSTADFQAGLIMGVPEMENSYWCGFRMKRNTVEGEIAAFSWGWTPQGATNRVTLNDKRNSFQFRLQGGKATALLNGREVLHEVTPGRAAASFGDEVYVGLGAYNDMNETVLRYRNVQVRRLGSRALETE